VAVRKRNHFPTASDAGFSLTEMLAVVSVFAIVAATAVPVMRDVTENMRLAQGAREVERELQTARLKAVSSNRAMRVRFNCPVAGQYRMVELLGTPTKPTAEDDAANRCQVNAYPSPAADTNPITVPNHDGPVRRLPKDVSFGAFKSLEFWPDGSVHIEAVGAPWPIVPPPGTAISVTKGLSVKQITVNGLGKIQLQ
jgi:prepilin-type N-terminal cleavage/methylation domain-containing protein